MIRLVTFDIDETLTVGTTIWEQIYHEIGTWETVGQKYLNQYREGKITFDEFIRLDVEAFGGNPESIIYSAINKINFISGIKETIDGLKERGIKSAIVSASIGQFADYLKAKYKFDYSFANPLLTDKNKILTGGIDLLVPAQKKCEVMKKLKIELGLKNSEVMAVGDSPLDFCMFDECAYSGCVEHAPQKVKDRVDFVLPDQDLGRLLDIIDKLNNNTA